MMKKFFALTSLLLCINAAANAQILQTTGGGRMIAPPVAVTSLTANYTMLFNTRARIESSPNTTPPNLSVVTRVMINTPTWQPKNPKLYFPCWYGDNTGAYPIEKTPSGDCTIDGATLEYPANTFTTITFGGSNSVTIPAGSGIWSDAVPVTLPANSSAIWVRSSWTVPNGSTMFGNYNMMPGNGEGASYAAAAQTALLTSTNFSTSSTSQVPGPSLFAAQGWNGTPVVIATGDSIGEGQTENEHAAGNTRGDFGYVMRGLDDAVGSARMAAANIAIPGADCGHDANAAAGYYGRRLAMLADLPNIPFTTILSEHGTNDSAVADMKTWWTFLKSSFPNTRLVQTTIPPHTTTAAQTLFDSNAAQTPFSASYTYPSGSVWVLNAALMAGTYNSYVDGVIDINPYASGNAAGAYDRWYVPPFTTTLATALSATGQVSITTNAAPNVSDSLVIDSGTSSVDGDGGNGLIVSAVSGSGPYTVTLGNGGGTNVTHSNGAGITESCTHDGLHPTQNCHIRISQAIIAAKNAGLFH